MNYLKQLFIAVSLLCCMGQITYGEVKSVMDINTMDDSEVQEYINRLNGDELKRLATLYNVRNLQNIEKLYQLKKRASAIDTIQTIKLVRAINDATASRIFQKNEKDKFDASIAQNKLGQARLELMEIIENSKQFTKQNIRIANNIQSNGLHSEIVLDNPYYPGAEFMPLDENESPYENQNRAFMEMDENE